MLEFFIILIVGVGGIAGAPWWFIIPSAGGLCIDSWSMQHGMMKVGHVPLDKTLALHFAAPLGGALIVTSTGYIVGALARHCLP